MFENMLSWFNKEEERTPRRVEMDERREMIQSNLPEIEKWFARKSYTIIEVDTRTYHYSFTVIK
jgi:hypothetical protein